MLLWMTRSKKEKKLKGICGPVLKTKIRKIKENLRFSNISMQNSLKNLDSREELTKNYLVAQLWSVVIFFDPPATLRGKQGKYYLQFGDQRRFRFREK